MVVRAISLQANFDFHTTFVLEMNVPVKLSYFLHKYLCSMQIHNELNNIKKCLLMDIIMQPYNHIGAKMFSKFKASGQFCYSTTNKAEKKEQEFCFC